MSSRPDGSSSRPTRGRSWGAPACGASIWDWAWMDLLRCPDRAPAMRADLALDNLTGAGPDEVRTARALMAALRRVLILNRWLGHLLLCIGGSTEHAQEKGGEGETSQAGLQDFST